MSNPTVTDTILKPDGSPDTLATVTIDLAGTNPALGTQAVSSVVGRVYLGTNASGVWSTSLVPNSLISPAGSSYRVTVKPSGAARVVYYITVPNGSGPYQATSIISGTPTTLATTRDIANGYDIRTVGAVLGGDIYAALVAAQAATSTGDTIFIPPGHWTLSAAVTLNKRNLSAGGATVTVSSSLGTDVSAITFTSDSVATTDCLVTGLTLVGPGARSLGVRTAACDGLEVTGYAQPTFRDIVIKQFDSGMVWNNTTGHISLENCNITDNYYGIYCQTNTFDYYVANSQVNGNTFANLATPANQGFGSLTMINVHCGFAPYGIYQEATPASQGTFKIFLQDVELFHTRFEAIGNGAIVTDASDDASNRSSSSNVYVLHPGFSWSGTYKIAARNKDYAVVFTLTERTMTFIGGAAQFLTGDVGVYRVKTATHNPFVVVDNTTTDALITINAGTRNTVLGTGLAAYGGNQYANGVYKSEELASAPANPTSGSQVQTYMKGDKYVVAYNHGGTMKYRYLDLTSTDATWTYTTTAP